MHLINTRTLELTEFADSNLPTSGYAILSHRWLAAGEVSFHDLPLSEDVTLKQGYSKLKTFCSIALSLGHEYAWCDTCCINKDSATELQSALNSMFRWYAAAKVCIVYLRDVNETSRAFQDSEWFQRGWTLQELIAPFNMRFYDQNWRFIGTKHDLLEELYTITQIPRSILDHTAALDTCSVAQRMSWAANRITERIEDRAYSLLGIFDVSLDQIYGEQEKAFVRLQERIIKDSADQSIFAWAMDLANHPDRYSGLFAPSPDAFVRCSNVIQGTHQTQFSLTNLGLLIRLPTLPYDMETHIAVLDCASDNDPNSNLAILVGVLPSRSQFARVMSPDGKNVLQLYKSGLNELKPVEREICIPKVPREEPLCFSRTYGFWLRTLPDSQDYTVRVLSRSKSLDPNYPGIRAPQFGTVAVVSVEPRKKQSNPWNELRWFKIGFNDDFTPVLMVSNYYSVAIPNRYAEYFDEVSLVGPDSTAWSQVFDNSWIRTKRLRNQQKSASVTNDWLGFHIIDHMDSSLHMLETQVPTLHLYIKLSLEEERSSPAPMHPSKLIWTIDIQDLRRTQPPETKRIKGLAAASCSCISSFH